MSKRDTHTLYIFGNAYEVPSGFTIMACMEYAGFRLTRGCGCRGAVCGACAVVYRIGSATRWSVGLACQTLSQDGMHFLFLPYSRGQEGLYDAHTTACTVENLKAIHPNLTRCIQCNTCTKSCPMGLKVLKYMRALLKENFDTAQCLSKECIQCGLCAVRCPAEIAPFAVALTARRLYAMHRYTPTDHFRTALARAREKHWEEEIASYKNMCNDEILSVYKTLQTHKGAGVNSL